MATTTTEGTAERDLSRREERAHRILDAVADLILRWGYDKTTIDDIARTAGVAKGTIYLHWRTRDALFVALLRRERLAMLEAVRQHVTRSADDATLSALLTHLAHELIRHPVVKAVFVRDTEVLGRLARQKQASEGADILDAGFAAYLDALRDAGAVRTDLSTAEVVNVIGATLYGTFLVSPLMPDGYRLADERLAEMVGDMVHHTLEPDRQSPARDAASVAHATLDYLDLAIRVTRDKLVQSLTTRRPGGQPASPTEDLS